MPLCKPHRGKRMEKIRPSVMPVIFIVLALFLFVACFTPHAQTSHSPGVYHLVKRNETFWSIARAYGIPLQELAEINKIEDVSSIEEGSVIFIPDAVRVIEDVMVGAATGEDGSKPDEEKNTAANTTKINDDKKAKPLLGKQAIAVKQDVRSVKQQASQDVANNKPDLKVTSLEKKVSPRKTEKKSPAKESQKIIKAEKNSFFWPVRGRVKTSFGVQPNKTYHNWIKIVSSAGMKVKAAAAGTVIFSSNLKNYGETIIIRHKNNYATVYTHLKKRYVKIDRSVKKGEIIAVLGEKDDAGEAYMNFEVRFKGKAQNPLLFLP